MSKEAILMLLFIALLGVPLIEIALFVTVGERIGLVATLAIVLVTAVIGASALRGQGFAVLRRAQSMSRPEDVSDLLLEGLLLFAAGLLLLTPGFLTDTIGFLLLIPPLRRFLARRMARHAAIRFTHMQTGAARPPEPDAPPRAASEPAGAGDAASPWAARQTRAPKRGEADEAVIIAPGDPAPPRGAD